MGNKILLIESDAASADQVQRPLIDAGFEVIVASDVDDGRELFASSRPDLAVIEVTADGLLVTDLVEGVSREDLQSRTGAPLRFAETCRTLAPDKAA